MKGKRLLAGFLTMVLLFSMLPADLLAESAQVLYRDANGDGKVDLKDVLLIEEYAAGKEVEIQFRNADVNADGKVDLEDAQEIREYLVGNRGSLASVLCTVSFDTCGGTPVEAVSVRNGYTVQQKIAAPTKENAVFLEWRFPDGTPYRQDTDIITEDTVLTAAYEETGYEEELNITTFSLENQQTDVEFEIESQFTTESEILSRVTLVPKDGTDPVEAKVKPGNEGNFIIYTPEGFRPGSDYELTIGEGLVFSGKDPMYRTIYFSIARQVEDHLVFNADMIFVQDTEEMFYTVDGQTLEVLQSSLLSNYEEDDTSVLSGTFTMPSSVGELQAGDVVCIYEKEDPRTRDYTTQDYQDDACAYIRILSKNASGSVPVYGFESLNQEDTKEVLATPDTVPYQVDTLPEGERGTVSKEDYDRYARAMLGFTEAPAFEVYDFLVFYTGEFSDLTEASPRVYGQIEQTDEDTVTYRIVTQQEIEDFNSMYVEQHVSADEMLNALNQEAFLQSVAQQAKDSNFIGEAAAEMIRSSFEGEDGRKALLDYGLTEEEIDQMTADTAQLNSADVVPDAVVLAASGSGVKVTIEEVSVVPGIRRSEYVEDGIGVTLDVSVTLSINKKMKLSHTQSQLKIVLFASFEQEIGLDIDVDVSTEWKWILFIPILKEVYCGVSVEIGNYTYVHLGAKSYTVTEGLKAKKWKAMANCFNNKPITKMWVRQIDQYAAKLQKLDKKTPEYEEIKGKMEELQQLLNQEKVTVDGEEYTIEMLEKDLEAQGISTEFVDAIGADSTEESKIGMQQLVDRYTEMMQQESDWVTLFEQMLFEQEIHIKIVAIKISATLVARASINISIGAEVEYQVGKRYDFWVKCFAGETGSSETDIMDERFGFQFYVMGTLKLRVGVKAAVDVGIFTTKIGSIGVSLEFGPYLKIYGYFCYIFNKVRPANTNTWKESEECQGALYLEFGLYLTVRFKAQLLDDTFKFEPTLFDKEFALLKAGERENIYNMVFQPTEEDILYIKDEDSDSTNGITMNLPLFYYYMRVLDLVDGTQSLKLCDRDQFHITFSSEYFSIDEYGKVTVTPPAGSRYLKTDMRVVYQCGKLSFSKFDIDITAPVVWTNMSEEELNEKFTVTVAAGSKTFGYTPVWSERYSRLDIFDLPTGDQIRELCGYDNFMDDFGNNLKYTTEGAYTTDKTTGLSTTTDITYYFDLPERVYTLTVEGIQNADGSTRKETYTAVYGTEFNLAELAATGTNNPTTSAYTSFTGLRDGAGNTFSLTQTVDWSYATNYGADVVLWANYQSDTVTATFRFSGVTGIADLEVPFKSGETPSTLELNAHAGDAVQICSISPAVAPSFNSVVYDVVCATADPAKPVAKYTVTYQANGGICKTAQAEYAEGGPIYLPAAPVKTGYRFTGWYYDAECTDGLKQGDRMPGHDLTLYAGWQANTYVLTMKSGNDVVAQVEIPYGGRYGDYLVTPQPQADFAFEGYYTRTGGSGTKITEDMIYETASDQTIYAFFKEKKTVNLTAADIAYTTNQYAYGDKGFGFVFTMAENSSYKDLLAENFILQYRNQSDTTAEWSTEEPSLTGMYDVTLQYAGDEAYKASNELFLAAVLNIERGTVTFYAPSVSIQDRLVYVSAPSAMVFADTGIDAVGKVNMNFIQYYYSLKGQEKWSLIYKDGSTGSQNGVIFIPMESGEFEIKAVYEPGSADPNVKDSVAAEYAIVSVDENGNPSLGSNQNLQSADTVSGGDPAAAGNENLAGENGFTEDENAAGNSALAGSSAIREGDASVPGSGEASELQNTQGQYFAKRMSLTEGAVTEGVSVTLSAEDLYAYRGQRISVPVSVDKNLGLWGILAGLTYDTSAMTFEGVRTDAGEVFSAEEFTVGEDLTACPYRFLATAKTLENVTRTGAFVTLEFTLHPHVDFADYTIGLSVIQAIGIGSNVLGTEGKDGTVFLRATPTGEGDEDGEEGKVSDGGDAIPKSPATGEKEHSSLFAFLGMTMTTLVAAMCAEYVLCHTRKKKDE